MVDLEKELELAIHAAKEAGKFLRKNHDVSVLSEIGKDIHLNADKNSEDLILKILSNSDYPILSEETGLIGSESSDYKWIVDPLDGSVNFQRGLPQWAVSIALFKDKEYALGVVYDGDTGEVYHALKDKGAFVSIGGSIAKQNKISVSNVSEKKKGIICTGFPPSMDFSDKGLTGLLELFRDYKKTRLYGCPAVSMAYVASGKADAYYESPINFWDVAAGIALVKEAGGEIKYKELYVKNKLDLFASNGKFK